MQYLLPKKCFAPISLPMWIIVQVKFDVQVPGGGCQVGVCLHPRSHQRCICTDGDGLCHVQITCFSHKNIIISVVQSSEVHWKLGHCKCLHKQKKHVFDNVTTIFSQQFLMQMVYYPHFSLNREDHTWHTHRLPLQQRLLLLTWTCIEHRRIEQV